MSPALGGGFLSTVPPGKSPQSFFFFKKKTLTFCLVYNQGICAVLSLIVDFPVAQTVKNLPAMQETRVQSQGGEDPLEKGMATHSSILAWRIPWTVKPGGL